MSTLEDVLTRTPIAYISRDIERAIGLSADAPGYFIITNTSSFAKEIAREYKDRVLLVGSNTPLDTEGLLRHETTRLFLQKHTINHILVFKNTLHIGQAAASLGLNLLNPRATISKEIEEKISQIAWLGDLASYLPPHTIRLCKDLTWSGQEKIVQFNHAHTGDGTFRLTAEADIDILRQKFPNREVRVMDIVHGPTFTNNNVVAKDIVIFGNPSYQITGLSPFTDRPFATVGNDWGIPTRLLPDEAMTAWKNMVSAIGNRLREYGWLGLFGIDVMYDTEKKKLFLIEINARQPASTTFESQLQKLNRSSPNTVAIFEAHLAALLDLTLHDSVLIHIDTGAQIVYRMRERSDFNLELLEQVQKKLQNAGFTVLVYDNKKQGQELLRIQSTASLMRDHGVLNEQGLLIRDIVTQL